MKLFENPNDMAAFAVVAVVFGLIRIIVMPGERSWKTFVVTLFICVPVGIIAGGICLELTHMEYVAMGACSVASLMAEKIIKMLMDTDLTGFVRDALNKLINKWTR